MESDIKTINGVAYAEEIKCFNISEAMRSISHSGRVEFRQIDAVPTSEIIKNINASQDIKVKNEPVDINASIGESNPKRTSKITTKMDKHKPRNPIDIRYCKFCKQTFISIPDYSKHLLNCDPRRRAFCKQRGDKGFECNLCGKLIEDAEKVGAHMFEHYQRQRLFACDLCNATFTTRVTCNAHVLRCYQKNSAADPTQIESSTEELYDNKSNIRRNPFYTCTFCHGLYTTQALLDAHETLHRDPSSKKYKCNICHIEYLSPRELDTHVMKSHKCNLCEKMFLNEECLMKHKRLKCLGGNSVENRSEDVRAPVKGEEDSDGYLCGICEANFDKKDDLVSHMSLHIVSDNKCNICSKTFVDEDSLIKHMDLHNDVPGVKIEINTV